MPDRPTVPVEMAEELTRVFVDAKIVGRDNPGGPMTTYVGYVVEGSDLRDGRQVDDAFETDDAEIEAILFAIRDLNGSLREFVVVCDHQSVVSEATRPDWKVGKKPEIDELRRTLSGSGVKLEALQSNPAHGFLTEYVNRQKTGMSPSE